MANIVTVSGMFGEGHTYFADSPVVIDISGLYWGDNVTSPFTVVRVEVVYKKPIEAPDATEAFELITVGDFHADTGGQTEMSFDISTALKAIWSDYEYADEVAAAQRAANGDSSRTAQRAMREYVLRIYTEYLTSDGVFTQTRCEDEQGNTDIPGGQCLMGGYTPLERSLIANDEDRDVSHLEHTGVRNGDASTKPTSTPEHVGINSITSWVDVQEGFTVQKGFTKSIFYPASESPESDDNAGSIQGWTGHAPIVVRDNQPYTDFLFTNRRGAVETCSALMKEQMSVNVDTEQYSRTEGPSFRPTRSLSAIGTDGRRSWQMSSGYVTREWAEWWVMEFLGGKRKQWWMLWQGPGMTSPRYVPVTVKPAKNETVVYDRAKQELSSIEFTVTLALEG